MADTTVYFATNRRPDPAQPGGFGADIIGPTDQAIYAVVPVTGIRIPDENSGTLGVITEATPGDFAETVRAEIETTGRNLLVFIHGFDNSFEDAIKRAGYVREWFAVSGVPAADTTVLAFTWPSAGVLIDNLPNPPQQAYLNDQAKAGQSAPHLAAFLGRALELAASVHRSGRRVFLLAHSMGNHALSSAIPVFFANHAPAAAIFDEAILPAADEVDTTLRTPADAMFRLRDLAARISVYCSLRDIAMDLSMSINKNPRLGYAGPSGKHDGLLYPPATFRTVDCTQVFDYLGLVPPDATHQYYRRSKTVRADITRLMALQPVTAGVSSLSALPFGV